jgi:membrane-bound metal-dependent hydrolase YbcI (DUF457 family)
MFIGHFALGFAAKKRDKKISLGTLFIAVQWLDLLWPFFILTGIEKVSIDPGNTVLTPLNFEYYPWSHSMLMAILWGVLFALIYYTFTKNRSGAILLSLLVFSHWALDWLTHRADLPLTPFTDLKTGLGLWDYKLLEIFIESLLFIISLLIYTKATRPKNKTGTWSLWGLIVFLLIIHFMNILGPPPPNVNMIGWAGFFQWLIVAWGYWIDRNRR